MSVARTVVAILLALLAVPASAVAQGLGSTAPPRPPAVEAARLETAIAVDGRLDEAAWQKAPAATGLRQYQPKEGDPESLRTEVRFLFDDRALYIGARMIQPEGVIAPLARRDQLLDASGDNGSFNSLTTDKLIVRLDPVPQPPGRRLVRGEPQRIQGGAVQRGSVVGPGMGSGHPRRLGGMVGGDAHPFQPTPLLP